MIKLMFYEADEYKKLWLDNKIHVYSEDDFDLLLRGIYDEESNSRVKPFRDECSIRFLKDTYDLEFVSEDDWYSIWCREKGRICISTLSRTMKYALTLIYYARLGICVKFKKCEERIWKVLDTMPFDIVLPISSSEFSGDTGLILGVEYIIENYLLNGKRVQLNVVTKGLYGKEGYEKEDIFYKKDGRYYVEDITLEYLDYHYFWKDHISDIIEKSKLHIKEEHPIISKTMVCNLKEFVQKINVDVDYFMSFNDYAEGIRVFEDMRKNNEITEEEYNDFIENVKERNKEQYKKYLWMVNDLKIVCHLYTMPNTRLSRKLPMMIIDKYPDGSYKIWGMITFKYPEFDEILGDIIENYYSEECERYIIIVDVEELFQDADDIKYANCGFKITKNCIEIFDQNDSIKLFADMAQEALDSGNYSISKEFY